MEMYMLWLFTNDGSFMDSTLITVLIPVTSVSLPATLNLIVGETSTLVPDITPADASNQDVTWVSSNSQIATVANGLVTAVAAGTAKIRVTTDDGNFHADCDVTVNPSGIADLSSDVRLYPVPASSVLILESKVSNGYAKILDLNGRTVQVSEVKSNHHEIDVSMLKPGFYSLILESDNNRITMQFIKK